MNKQQMMRNFCLYRKEDERMEQESKPKKKKKQRKIGDAATKSLMSTKLEPSLRLHSPHCELNEHVPTRLLVRLWLFFQLTLHV